MTKRFRTILFLSFVALFFLTAPLLILYSQGYRFDMETKKIVQTGGLFLKIQPTGVEIYVNSSLEKKTNLLFKSALIQNLIPDEYNIEIKKQGYFPWEKTLGIKEKQVTEAKNIVLIPENPNFEILFKNVKDFWFSADEKKLILKEIDENGWALKFLDIEKNIKSHLISSQDISKKEVELISFKISSDSKKILLETGLKEQLRYYILDLTKSPVNLISLDFLGKNPEEIRFNPKNSEQIFFLKNKQFFKGNFIKEEISLPILNNVLIYQIYGQDIYFLENSGNLYKTNFSFDTQKKLTSKPFALKTEINHNFEIFKNFIFLIEGQNLFILNSESGLFEKLSDEINLLKLSPDNKKIVYLKTHEIWAFFLENISDQPERKAEDNIFLTRFSEKINNVFWYSSHYLLFNINDKVKIAEIDDRDKINIVNLKLPAKFNGELKIFFNKNSKKLYILSEDNLYISEKLLP